MGNQGTIAGSQVRKNVGNHVDALSPPAAKGTQNPDEVREMKVNADNNTLDEARRGDALPRVRQ